MVTAAGVPENDARSCTTGAMTVKNERRRRLRHSRITATTHDQLIQLPKDSEPTTNVAGITYWRLFQDFKGRSTPRLWFNMISSPLLCFGDNGSTAIRFYYRLKRTLLSIWGKIGRISSPVPLFVVLCPWMSPTVTVSGTRKETLRNMVHSLDPKAIHGKVTSLKLRTVVNVFENPILRGLGLRVSLSLSESLNVPHHRPLQALSRLSFRRGRNWPAGLLFFDCSESLSRYRILIRLRSYSGKIL
jgi:hypothetical protein